MSLFGGEMARRTASGVEIRTQPLRVRWTIGDVAAGDGHRLNCSFACSVAAVDRPADKQMLAETFLAARDTAEAYDVQQHFQPAFAAAAAQLAATRPAEQWLTESAQSTLAEALRSTAKPIAFACGLDLLPPFEVQLASPTVERLRIESMERQLAERRAAGQVEHFQRAAELLKSFDALRSASPGVSVGRVLDAVSAADRGAMLQTLLAASAPTDGAGRVLWAVGGMGMMTLSGEGAVKKFELPTGVGPPRSLRADRLGEEPVWLIGCRCGVVITGAAGDVAPRGVLRDDAVQSSPLGFSRAVLHADGQELTACHGDAGIVRWRLDRTESPVTTLRPASGEQPRNLVALDAQRLIYSGGRNLVVLIRGERTPLAADSEHAIVALLPHERELLVVHADGEVVHKDRLTLDTVARERHCGRASAAALLPWVGGARLLLATEDGPICCIGLEDSVVTQYVSRHRGLKALAASSGLVAAISGDRQRVILWNAWDGRSPATEVSVAARTRHRVADIAFPPVTFVAGAAPAPAPNG